jgi:pilus assembly protein FimV
MIVSLLVAAHAPLSWGLGLGEIELKSALNQKFNATIELFDASGLEPDEIMVSLGSPEDFERVGVERFFFLTNLSFEVGYAADGGAQIQVTSSQPITEPYLNFLVEVLWPNGRLLKEYTVLLDPPTYSDAAAPVVSAPTQNRAASNTGRVQRVEPPGSGTQVQMNPQSAPRSEPSPLDQGIQGDEYGMTDRDDTLWSIAQRARPSGDVSVQQTMLAIEKLNPEAFINGNINLLKAGYRLKLPNEAQAKALTAEQALGEVARHDEEWRAYNRGEAIADRGRTAAPQGTDETSDLRSPMDASARTTAATSVAATDGELRIVAEDGDSTTGRGQATGPELQAAREETDRMAREVEQLTYQLDHEKELSSNEIAVRERQIEVKDQQIAELQAQLAAARDALETQSETQPETAPPATQSQNQNAQAESAPWWQSPIVMYGGAGVLVLLLVGGMIASRKRRAAEAENDYFDAEEAYAEEDRVEPVFADLDHEDDEDEAATVVADAEEDETQEVTGSQTSDVIGEADIYIAYGRFPQAIGLLLGVLEDDPERNDARLKLLEVYAETGDRGAFDEHMTALLEYCDDEEALLTARELQNRFGEESVTLDDMMADERSTPAVDEGASGDALGVDDGAPAPGSALQPEVEPEVAAAPEVQAESDSALDFELELDELESGASEDAEDAEKEGAGDQLGGDLGMDFNPEEPEPEPEPEPEEEASAERDNGIEFEPMSRVSDEAVDEDELTIDADLEEAAAGIRGGADLGSNGVEVEEDEGELAIEADAEGEDLLADLEFESATPAEDDFEFEDEGDSANTKLDLARAYIDMGDADGARDILKEVLDEGNSDQQQKAQAMLESL